MRLSKAFGALAVLVVSLAACSHGERRFKAHQAEFDASSPEAQRKIRKGEVAVGFTPEQVELALGRPSRVYTKVTPASTQEIWVYGIEAGQGTGTIPRSDDPGIVVGDAAFEEIERVVFEKRAVAAVVKRLR